MMERAETNLGRVLSEDLDNGRPGSCSTGEEAKKEEIDRGEYAFLLAYNAADRNRYIGGDDA
jgi:hypothetical protein